MLTPLRVCSHVSGSVRPYWDSEVVHRGSDFALLLCANVSCGLCFWVSFSYCLSLVLSFLTSPLGMSSSSLVTGTRRSRFSAPSVYLCLQPHGVWSCYIPSCHWRGWLMFRECSGGWCLPLPLHVSTWHVPSGKHIHNCLNGLRCLPSRLAISMARYLYCVNKRIPC